MNHQDRGNASSESILPAFRYLAPLIAVGFVSLALFPVCAVAQGPCCSITAIDQRTGIVTGKVNATSQLFEFKLTNPALLQSLKVGEAIYANFTARQVSLDGKSPCGTIVATGSAPQSRTPTVKGAGAPQLSAPSQPAPAARALPLACCGITSIDASKNLASAKENSTGRTFQFRANKPAAMASLKVGESIYANFPKMQVSLDGKTVCCQITAQGISSSNSGKGPPAVGVRNPIATHSGWMRYGKVAGTFPGGITLVPVASVLPSGVPTGVSTSQLAASNTARGGIDFPVPVNPPGLIKGTTEVKTTEALRGFEGRVVVFLLDENGQPIFQTSEGPWGVNGTAIPGAPSDRTVDWSEPVPADAMALARKIVILHSYAAVDKWEDTLIQGATDLGYVILGIACLLMGNQVVIGTDGFSCQPPSGGGSDSAGSSQAVATGASVIFSKPVPLQSPHSGQIVWVNLQARQALWTAFPITAQQQDDLGDSHYMDTYVTVFYPLVGQPGTFPGAGGSPAGPLAPQAGANVACCGITGIDARPRLVAAKVNSTSQAFEFSVPDSVPIQNLHAGQPVWANFKSGKVSLDGRTACCEILAGRTAQPPGLTKSADASAWKTAAASAPSARPSSVVLGDLWVPLGRVVSVGPNQLSIRTLVSPSAQKSPGGPAEKSSRGPAEESAPAEGPMVTVGVEMASQPRPTKLATIAAQEAPTAGKVGTQSQIGQNTLSLGEITLEPPVPPHPGQMVWVSHPTRRIRWVNFPFSMTQDDDLGDSHHLKTQITASLPSAGTQGLVKGETELWTFREIGGFNGRVGVTFADDMNRPLFIASRPRPNVPGEADSWHVCGHSEYWCASDVTRDWGESIPADLLGQVAKVSIKHGAEDTLGADLLQLLCDVVPCSVGHCSHPPSAQTPPSPQNPDPCGPPTGTPPGPGSNGPPTGNAASAAGPPQTPLANGASPVSAPTCLRPSSSLQAQTPARRTPGRSAGTAKPATASGADQPKYKAVWEPVSYHDDIFFRDVFFVSDNRKQHTHVQYGNARGESIGMF